MGTAGVLIPDISDTRLAIARQCGMDYAGNTANQDFSETLVSCFGPDQADVIFDCTGNDVTIGRAIRWAADGKIRLKPLITRHFAFQDYLAAYQYIDDNRESTMKVLINAAEDDA